VGARDAEKIVNRMRRCGHLVLVLSALFLSACSRPSTQTASGGSAPPGIKPLMSQADADKLIAERFPIGRYVVHDFIPKPGAPPPSPITPKRTLKVGLYWVMNDELTPWYVAQEKGFFSNVGLDVQIIEGGPGRDMLSSLIANRIDLYIGPAENALFVINSRTGADLKMICALMKDTPAGFIGIDKTIPRDQVSTRHIGREDLIGRRIATAPGSGYDMDIICSELNIPPDQINLVASGATPDGLLTGSIDYYGGFRTNQPRILERNGYKNWTFFPLSDVGMRDYFDVSIVTADLYQHEPQVLANYVYALNEAMEYEMAHPDEAADIAIRYTPEFPVTKAEVLERMKQDFPIYRGDGSEPILAMKESVVAHQLAMLYRYRQIELPGVDAGAPTALGQK
jgi:ABC-type nitrate/sulfonate/bicarbonate transport system substrate-binding protein